MKCESPLAIRPLLYSDTLNDKQVLRDDLWAVSTIELNDQWAEFLESKIAHRNTTNKLAEVMRKLELARAENERLREALLFVDKHCPCGARGRDSQTHPHSLGCLVEKALASGEHQEKK